MRNVTLTKTETYYWCMALTTLIPKRIVKCFLKILSMSVFGLLTSLQYPLFCGIVWVYLEQ